ncbi:class I SAM-dependent rRNA methyltransferase [Papillibacter cinnamivorans]|uniref:23S rRNA (Cytosine1962-C5)-methyltransferase n=1 Tax=Papillibacter cinnamivorans DSM 12816 TaxID=1122930 RepID=A0A1W2CNZ4_9FIRM|nr:class I SAM-dependent rRNA methyltransferase [Papillibacter cinnamivorans]SMC86929.1 23S rRNA (cytosine1962-C5)-methyltransferase [Papillibacter cinnamivorans DSM 12816]
MTKIVVSKSGERRAACGHPWVFKTDIVRSEGHVDDGDFVEVCSDRKKLLGVGYYNSRSQITVRLLTWYQEPLEEDFLYRRILAAWEYRRRFADPESCRVVFGEADFLPGLIVDKFSDVLVIQTLALGIDRFKEQIVECLKDIIKPSGIFERNDVPVREREGLDQRKGFLSSPFETRVRMSENGILFDVDVENGQKTGYFLDQKENRAAISPFVKDGKVLDCFCHTGSFALHAAGFGAREVLGIDSSPHAVQFAGENAKLNSLEDRCRFETANAFDKLRSLWDSGEKFDAIILDPPAFAKSRNALEGAVRGYKEINLRAMKCIESGGFLITCSCSQHVSRELFLDILYDAAADARRKVRLIEFRSQAKDHPVLLAAPETDYLKCAILQII